MKKLITAAALAICTCAFAQEQIYFLPSTTVTVEAEAEQETFFAGPYAAFAKKLLNMDVRKTDEVTTRLLNVTVTSATEADEKGFYTLEGDVVPELMVLGAQGLISLGTKAEVVSASWRFLPQLRGDFTDMGLTESSRTVKRTVYKEVQTDTAFVRVPVDQLVNETKSLEDKAKEAADIILSARRHRMDIASGNTDATFSGEALADALKELRAIEDEYITLFRGYSITRTVSGSFDVVPQPTLKNQKYLVFRTDPERGLALNGKGTPYYLELNVEGLRWEVPKANAKKGKTPIVTYRIPAICTVTLTEDGKPLASARIPVYQFGKEATYSVTIQEKKK